MMLAAETAGSRRSPPTSRRCWRNATRCARPTPRPTSPPARSPPSARRSRRRPRRAVAYPAGRRRNIGGAAVPATRNPPGDPGRLLAAAFPDRIAQRRGEPGSFRLSGGGGGADAAHRPAGQRDAAGGGVAGTEGGLADPRSPRRWTRDNLPPSLAARVTETGGGRLRPGLRRGAVPPPPPAGHTDPVRPDGNRPTRPDRRPSGRAPSAARACARCPGPTPPASFRRGSR